jgi:RNA polymerase sigma-70 factor (ECF subfamily)
MQRAPIVMEDSPAGAGAPSDEGLATVFLANRTALLRFLRARCDAEAVEDLLQELWLRVQHGRSGPVAEPLSYLYRTAHNLVLDVRRGASRRRERETAWADAQDQASGAEQPSAERTLIASQGLRTASAVLAGLGPRVEQVFRRHRLDGAPQARIAAELGVSLSTVEKDLHKAYAALLAWRRSVDAE